MSANETAAAAPDPEDQATREDGWDIVVRMFRRKRSAVWGLRLTLGLVFIAIYAPVFCCALPFRWRGAEDTETTYPWFSRMFDVNYWKSPVDQFFNMLLVLVTLWVIWRGIRYVIFRGKQISAAFRKKEGELTKAYTWLGLILIMLQQLGAGFLVTSSQYQNYPEEARRMTEAGTPFEATFALIPYGHREIVADQYVAPMSFEGGRRNVLGSDAVGRDLMARLLYGTRVSMTVGLVAVAIYVLIGTLIGAFAGYRGGRWDIVIMRFVEVVMCVPGLFLILTIIALFENRSIYLIMGAIGIVGWTGIARLVRGEFIRERGKDYVTAARSLGLSGPRILFRHILPNAMGPVIVAATFGVASAILTESTLSFLGLGDTSVPSWGSILNKGRIDQEWHMIAAPGIAIFLTVTVLNLVGDGLRDALDPKLRK